MEMAKQPVISQKIYFPEFENYEIFEGKLQVEQKPGTLQQAFRYVGNGLGSLGSFFGNKYQEYDIGSKIKEGGAATLKGLANVGNYIYDLSKPLMKYASEKATEGVGLLYKQMKGEANDEKIGEEIKIERINNEDENNNNISNEEGNECRKSDLMFENVGETPIEEEVNENNNNMDYPTFSQVNIVKVENNNIDNSAAPLDKFSSDK